MRSIIKNSLLLLVCILSLSSCSKQLTPFTKQLYDEYRWSDAQLSKIQFYLSSDIVLQRTVGGDVSQISDGQIRIVDGQKTEEIVFKEGTPGVFVFSPKRDRMGISFESGGDENFLMFGPNSKLSGRYALLAKDWNKRSGKVSYKGKTYRTSSESAFASLLVDIKKAQKVKYTKTTVGGREIRK